MRERIGRELGRIPYAMRVLVGTALLIGMFFAVVTPLFNTSGPLAAEVDGALPATIPAGQPVSLELSIDNVGNHIINPVCLAPTFSRSVGDVTVSFQGLDQNIPVRNGRACGGLLTAQETISIKVAFRAPAAGPLDVSLLVAQSTENIGTPLHGRIAVQ